MGDPGGRGRRGRLTSPRSTRTSSEERRGRRRGSRAGDARRRRGCHRRGRRDDRRRRAVVPFYKREISFRARSTAAEVAAAAEVVDAVGDETRATRRTSRPRPRPSSSSSPTSRSSRRLSPRPPTRAGAPRRVAEEPTVAEATQPQTFEVAARAAVDDDRPGTRDRARARAGSARHGRRGARGSALQPDDLTRATPWHTEDADARAAAAPEPGTVEDAAEPEPSRTSPRPRMPTTRRSCPPPSPPRPSPTRTPLPDLPDAAGEDAPASGRTLRVAQAQVREGAEAPGRQGPQGRRTEDRRLAARCGRRQRDRARPRAARPCAPPARRRDRRRR